MTRLDSINEITQTATILSGLGLIIYFVLYCIHNDEYRYSHEDGESFNDVHGKYKSALVWSLSICLIISLILPTQKEALTIIVGGKALGFIESDTTLTKVPDQAVIMLNKYMDEKIAEIEAKSRDYEK